MTGRILCSLPRLHRPLLAPSAPARSTVFQHGGRRRATESHGAEQKSHFARSAFESFLRGPPWPSLRPPCLIKTERAARTMRKYARPTKARELCVYVLADLADIALGSLIFVRVLLEVVGAAGGVAASASRLSRSCRPAPPRRRAISRRCSPGSCSNGSWSARRAPAAVPPGSADGGYSGRR
jgi:hypothetical protein